jgi:hypothetical protein
MKMNPSIKVSIINYTFKYIYKLVYFLRHFVKGLINMKPGLVWLNELGNWIT